MGKKFNSVSVIIPAFNEEETIGRLVSEVKGLYPDFDVIVVNDGSTDHTARAAEDAGARVYSHPYNIGNGAAIKSGARIATGDVIVFMDGDGQHDPEDLKEMLKYFPDFDMVVGARNWRQTSTLRTAGNKIFNWLASYVAKHRILDLTSGFRAIKSEIVNKFLYLLPNTYSYPTTLTLGVLRNGRSLKYIPVKIHKRKAGKSKISVLKDGVRFIMIIMKICTLYSPLRIFLPVSFAMFLMGISYYMFTLISWGRFTNMSALLFTTSVMIFLMGLISEQICQMRFEDSETWGKTIRDQTDPHDKTMEE